MVPHVYNRSMNNNETIRNLAKLIGGTVAPANEIVEGDHVFNCLFEDITVETIEIVSKGLPVPVIRVNNGECVYQFDQLVAIV